MEMTPGIGCTIRRHSRVRIGVGVCVFVSSRRRHTRFDCDWSSDVCSSDLLPNATNPLYTLANRQIKTDRSRFTGYAKATYRIRDWLSFEGNYNYDQETSNFTNQVPKNFLNSHGEPTSGSLVKIDTAGRTLNTAATLTSVRAVHLGSRKLRASYGTAGLRPTFDAQYETFAVIGGVPVKQTLGNKTLEPARSAETEVGGNIDFLNDRVTLEYSYSRKETKDQIMLVPLSGATGYVNQWQNAATLLGHTHELSLGADLVDRPEFSWRLTGAAHRTRQRITQLNTPPFLVGPDYVGNNDVVQHFKIAAGETFGVIYGTKIVRTLADLYADPKKQALSGANQHWSPDSVIVNEDGFLVRKDLYHTIGERFIPYVDPSGSSIIKIADVNPDFNASFTTNVRYKNFSAYALVDWVQGGKIYNATRQWPFFEFRDRVYDQSSKPVATGCGVDANKVPLPA